LISSSNLTFAQKQQKSKIMSKLFTKKYYGKQFVGILFATDARIFKVVF
jgi:hypothetical protein